jgi:hypothetical protein
MLFRGLSLEEERLQNGANVSSVVRLRASVWRRKGLRMELG